MPIDTLVINPKRGNALRSRAKQQILSMKQAEVIAEQIEVYARTVDAKSDILDPDANQKFDFFSNRKHRDREL